MRELTDKELDKKLRTEREKLRKFRFASVLGKTKNTKEGRNVKKEIARVLTEVNRRKREAKELT